jgi:hypothetical protein
MTNEQSPVESLDEEFRETDAKLDALRARAEAARAEDETDRISRLWSLRQRVREKLFELKRTSSKNLDTTRHAAEYALHDLEGRIDRAAERFTARDYGGRDVTTPRRGAS